MKIGIDFDNTIVSYDKIIYEAALSKNLIPKNLEQSKLAVRGYLRENNLEDKWTNLQGYIYGVKITEANPFDGLLSFLETCKTKNISTIIVSHKTKYPFKGEKYDLHKAARDWLAKQKIFDVESSLNLVEQIFLEETKENKLARIGKEECDYFIDDLPEFLGEASFPSKVKKLLFDPNKLHENSNLTKFESWKAISNFLLS